MRSARLLQLVLAAVAAVVPSAEPASAQMLEGRVLDAVTGEPVLLAYVGLLEEGRNVAVEGLTDLDGAFTLEAPVGGSFFLLVRRDGYETLLEGLFELGDGGIAEVRVGLTPKPIELEAVTVETERDMNALERSGFYDRVLTAPGHFLTREEIERTGGHRIADVFRDVPRVAVDATRPVAGPNTMQNPSIIMGREGAQCSPTLYVDRHVVATGVLEPVRPDDYVSASEVEAIEVYTRASQVPVDFDPINDCGVILIWTRMR